jgi:L-aminopeptidase/D-esterase-like protein
MLIQRPPNRMIGEQNREERARLTAEAAGKPRPISNIGGGRGGSLMAFTAGTGTANGR